VIEGNDGDLIEENDGALIDNISAALPLPSPGISVESDESKP
jgi:hypothetical protein